MPFRPFAWLFLIQGLLLMPHARAAGPYLNSFDAVGLLPPPPPAGSVEDKADRDTAFVVYSHRTADDIARAKSEHEFDVFVFAPSVGPNFDGAHCPRIAALFAEVLKEQKPFTDRAKAKFNRPRPYVYEPERFRDHADTEKSAGYPSGHSTRGTLVAELLCQLFPGDRDAILSEGRLIGWTRVEAGVHTPLDIFGGRVLGQAYARAFLANPQFQTDLAAAKAEAEQVAQGLAPVR